MPSRNAQLNKIAANLRAARRPCFICQQPIDYSLPWDDPQAFTVEHIKPRSTHPHLVTDPGNCVSSHARCNKGRQNNPYKPGLGVLSQDY